MTAIEQRERLSAADWDTWWSAGKEPGVITDVEQRKFLTRVRPKATLTAVDVCCGNGRWTRQLARWGMNVIGFDFSRAAITEARRGWHNPRLRYELWDADADAIPRTLKPGSVDMVTVRLGLAYLDRQRFLVDVARWLRPDSGVMYAISDVVYCDDQEQDPFQRGLTEEQLASLGYGWASCERYSVGPRTALVLRGPGGLLADAISPPAP
ncbi:class I SAM-dependent methyltransferase [Streptomyces sp. DSM 41527]|uniref:Class I SAM-dependent methyltransferase n=1 Tax=Streptomyces mooreae TaxID=3075523 RepID=A0ABU2TDY8_9ACTN|nr:class I SAM-dependent methyltransferase [Streptomyces sp. DSM 41527]MDT0459161.1 class I SAM-dependent methyltransferase [Streptomyces sp. DSM 41527]